MDGSQQVKVATVWRVLGALVAVGVALGSAWAAPLIEPAGFMGPPALFEAPPALLEVPPALLEVPPALLEVPPALLEVPPALLTAPRPGGAALAGGGAGAAWEAWEEEGGPVREAQRKAAGQAALVAAADVKKRAYTLEGEAREEGLLQAAAAYADVADREDLRPSERAEAAFRAGEILRARKALDSARERFAQAMELGQGNEADAFAARGLLELAHMKRRDDDTQGALALYGELRTRFPAQRKSCAQAMTWAGKLQLREGSREEGLVLLIQFGKQFDEFPVDAVKNVDVAALDCLDVGEFDRARRLIDDLRERMQPVLEQVEGKDAERLRKALADMKAPPLLDARLLDDAM